MVAASVASAAAAVWRHRRLVSGVMNDILQLWDSHGPGRNAHSNQPQHPGGPDIRVNMVAAASSLSVGNVPRNGADTRRWSRRLHNRDRESSRTSSSVDMCQTWFESLSHHHRDHPRVLRSDGVCFGDDQNHLHDRVCAGALCSQGWNIRTACTDTKAYASNTSSLELRVGDGVCSVMGPVMMCVQ